MRGEQDSGEEEHDPILLSTPIVEVFCALDVSSILPVEFKICLKASRSTK
ncbi:MAG: hypothetical protein JWP08_3243 [Bryobacterales bacterium]|jgi:hypothetical protein|nr:hypothetical protein [Bryobacterales bacterium]